MSGQRGVGEDTVRILPLDGLRGIASIGIVFYHAYYPGWHQWLWSFVDLFFVLSGFLISRQILRGLPDRSFSLQNFMIHRALRIWPVYYLTLLCCVLPVGFRWLMTGENPNISGLLSSPFFLQFSHYYLEPGLSGPFQPYIPAFSHSWSLAVEEQFYILLPLLLLWCRSRVWVLVAMLCGCLVVAVYFRYVGAMSFLLVTRMDGLAIGVVAGCYWVYVGERKKTAGWEIRPRYALLVASLAIVLLSFYFLVSRLGDRLPAEIASWRLPLGVLGFSLIYGVLLLTLAKNWLPWLSSLLSRRLLLWFGGISYGLYMYHWPVRGALLYWDGAAQIAGASALVQIAYFVVPVSLAALSRVWLEQPISRFKRHFPIYQKPALVSPLAPGLAGVSRPSPAPDGGVVSGPLIQVRAQHSLMS